MKHKVFKLRQNWYFECGSCPIVLYGRWVNIMWLGEAHIGYAHPYLRVGARG